MMKGSLMDTASGSVSANRVLSALAIYGESHWYWETDEAAFLGGPADNRYLTTSCTKERAGTEFPATEIYAYRYNQTVSYNCLLNEAVPGLFSASSGSTILSSYADLCKDIRDNIKNEPEKNGLSDTPGKDTEPGATPAASKDTAVAFKNTTVPSEDTAVASEDLAVISKAAESGSEINENAKAAPDTMRSFERALPWIIGGAVAVALAAVVLMKTSRSKRG